MHGEKEAASEGESWGGRYEIVPGRGVKEDTEHSWNRWGGRDRSSASIGVRA